MNMKINNHTSIRPERIDPATAARYLQKNVGNRKQRKFAVQELANAMRRGEWVLTHQGIAFDEDGNLIDGQHRLEAIILADAPVEMMVARGMPSASFLALDIGAKRTNSDILGRHTRTTEVANFIALLHTGAAKITPTALVEYVEMIEDTLEDLVAGCTAPKRFIGSAGMRAAAVLTILSGNRADGQYVKQIYRGLITFDIDNLPPIARSLLRQVENGHITKADGGGRDTSFNAFARGLMVFDKSRSHTTTLRSISFDTAESWLIKTVDQIQQR